MTKHCLACHEPFTRPKGVSLAQFAARKYCSPPCAYADRIVDVAEAFWLKVDKNGPVPATRPDLGQCWVWTAAQTGKGYGLYNLKGRMKGAHVLAYELAEGHPVPEGREIDHLCRVKLCVRRSHLEPVTASVNIRRANAAKPRKTHCIHGHSLADAYDYPYKRKCRTCVRIRDHQRRQEAA